MQGYADWVGRILNQKEGYIIAHTWTKGTPEAPPLPTAATYNGVQYGHSSELGPKFQKDWEDFWVQEDLANRRMMYQKIQQILATEMEEPIEDTMVEAAIYILKTVTAVGIDLWSPADLRKLPNRALKQIGRNIEE
eukprot:10781387-Karenia_brevis.AAC.1